MFLWDYLVTLDMEINYVWGQKLSAASGLFILNRYTNLLITILELIEQAPFETPQVRFSALALCSLRQLTRILEVCLSFCLPFQELTSALYSCTPVIRVLQSMLVFASLIVAGECARLKQLFPTWLIYYSPQYLQRSVCTLRGHEIGVQHWWCYYWPW